MLLFKLDASPIDFFYNTISPPPTHLLILILYHAHQSVVNRLYLIIRSTKIPQLISHHISLVSISYSFPIYQTIPKNKKLCVQPFRLFLLSFFDLNLNKKKSLIKYRLFVSHTHNPNDDDDNLNFINYISKEIRLQSIDYSRKLGIMYVGNLVRNVLILVCF